MVFAPAVAANASVSVGGWTALDTITAGANNTINATKTAGGKALKSAITIAPQAGKVGKYLLRGGAAGALALAVPQLIGEGVDWVLDPANNAVKYKDDTGGGGAAGQYLWRSNNVNYSTAEAACRGGLSPENIASGWSHHSVVSTGETSVDCMAKSPSGAVIKNTGANRINNPDWTGSPSDEYKYIPIGTVAQKVIANAEAGHAPSQEAVKATALEGFAAGEYDAALDAAAVPDTGVENPTDPTDPPKDPAAPFDPAGIISAINALKALLAGILASITGLSDIFNSDPPPEKTQKETDVPIDDLPPTKGASEFDVNYINFGGQCPVLPSFNIGIGGASSALTFDMTPLCDMALKIRPAVIAIAYFIGLGVIASAIRET